MKRLSIIGAAIALFFTTSCKKLQEGKVVWTGDYVEVDATVLNAPATGRPWPLLTRVPQGGRPVITAQDPLITRSSGKVSLRVNLVAPQRAQDETLTFKVVDSVTTAIRDTHYKTTGTLKIPANSSFGFIEVEILNPGATTGGAKNLVLELESSATLKANPNYNLVGISIAQN